MEFTRVCVEISLIIVKDYMGLKKKDTLGMSLPLVKGNNREIAL